MASLVMRCRDADMMGPVCDYVTDATSFDEAVREMRVHAMTHDEPEISEDDLLEIEHLICGSFERRPQQA